MDSNYSNNPNYAPNYSSAPIPAGPPKRLNGWVSFYAILIIISGALSAIFLIGIPFIFVGVKLLQAVNASKELNGPFGAQKMNEVFDSLNSSFKIWGITFIVLIAIYILVIIAFVAFGVFASMSGMSHSY